MDFIPVSEPNLSGREREYVDDCLASGWISSKGKYIQLFEEGFARRIGVRHAIAVCNGTCAVHLALAALGIKSGDEVVVPTLTFIAVPNAVAYTGAKPVFIDSDPVTWNIDPEQIAGSITPRTRAILAVHLYGHPCDMDAILAIARKRKLFVVEDAAEAIGSRYRGGPVGSRGDIAAFSFFGNKTITTGEGGMVATNSAALAARARLLRGQAMSPRRRYFFETIGYNYRMTNIQAAIGLAQIQKLDYYVDRKREIAATYSRLLRDVDGLVLPVEKEYAFNTYWMYSILVERGFGVDRDALMANLKKRGIETRPFFYPCHTMPAYAAGSGAYPVAQTLSDKGLNLPSSTMLTDRHIQHVVDSIKSSSR